MVSEAQTTSDSAAAFQTTSNLSQLTSFLITNTENIICGVPQGSILGPLLFLHLSSIMFADETNLFLEHKNLDSLFDIANHELLMINDKFWENKVYFFP